MIKPKNIRLFFVIALLTAQFCSFSQNNKLKEFDRKKWKELVNEVKKKRYDPREKNENFNSKSSTEQEYYSIESEEFREYEGGSGDGTYDGGNGSGNEGSNGDGSGEYSDGGIYSDSGDDDVFFDEKNDKKDGTGSGEGNGNGDGKGNGNGEDGDLDPRYGDDESGSTSDYKPEDFKKDDYSKPEKEPERVKYTPPPPPSESEASSAAGGGDSTWLVVLLIVILAAAIVYMVLVSFSQRNKKVKQVLTTEEKIENLTITKSELELALEAAINDKNFREAVRIYFIAVIKEMKDRSWIKWEKKKTNYHYISEIYGRNQQPDFITATRAFEIVWYGNRTIAENEYYQVEPLFKRLLNSIQG